MFPNLSKAQLLNYLQCPRRFWLDQYHPENEGDVEGMDDFLDAEEGARAIAHSAVSGDAVYRVNARLGQRSAIEQTSKLLAPGVILVNATFEHEGIAAQVDVLDWTSNSHRAISVTAASDVTRRRIEDCAIQAWTMRGLELPKHEFVVGLLSSEDAGDLYARFQLTDVSDEIEPEIDRINAAVDNARRLHAALEQPQATTGPHCQMAGYACPFLDYCEQE